MEVEVAVLPNLVLKVSVDVKQRLKEIAISRGGKTTLNYSPVDGRGFNLFSLRHREPKFVLLSTEGGLNLFSRPQRGLKLFSRSVQFNVALRPQRPKGTGSPGRPSLFSHSP